MARQIDIDLLLPKLAKLRLNSGTEKRVLTVEQVLWLLEQECALQNSTDNVTTPDTSNKNGLYIKTLDRFHQEWASSANVVDCQDELSEIQSSRA